MYSFFVRSHDTHSIGGIPEGPYHIAFTTALDWIDADDGFRWQPAYFDFDRTFVCIEKKLEKGIRILKIIHADERSIKIMKGLDETLRRERDEGKDYWDDI